MRSVAKSFTPGPGQSYASVQIYNSADTNATPYTSWLARSVDGEVQIIGDKPYGKQIGMEVFTSIRRNSTYEATFKDGILILKPVVSASAIGTSVRADFKRVLTEMKEAGTPLTYIIEGVTRLEDDSKLVRNDGKQISVVSDTAVKIENASASEDSGQGTSARAKIARAQRGIPVHYWVSFDHIAFVGTSEEADKYVKDPKAYREAEIKATEDGSTTTASANGFGPSYPALVNVPGVVLFSFDMPGKGYLVVKCLGNAGEDKNKFHFLFKDPENKDKVPFAKVASYLSTGTGASKIDAVPEVVQQVITYMTEYLVAYYNEHNISFEETSSSAELKAVNINAAYAITFKGDTVDGKRPPLLTIGFTYNPEGKPATIIVTTRDKGAKEFPIPQTADAAAIGEAEIARVVDLCAGQYSSNEDFKTAVADYLRDQASLVDSIKVLTGQQIVNVDDASSTVACASEKARVILIAAKSAAEHGLDRLGKAGVESYLEAHGNPQQAAIAVTWIKSENREINDRKAYEILSQAKESYESIIVGLIRDFTIVQGWLGTFQMSLIEDADPDKIEAFNRLCDSVNSVDANKWDKGYQRLSLIHISEPTRPY